MATFFNSIHFYLLPSLSFLILHLLSLSAGDPTSRPFLQGFDNADFGSNFALSGDAHPLVNATSCVDLTNRSHLSSGNVVFKKPLRLFDRGESRHPVSFSTDFVFSVSSSNGSDGDGDGDGLALVIAVAGEPSRVFGQGSFGVSRDFVKNNGKFVAVEYGSRKDVDGGHVRVDVGSFVSKEDKDLSPMGLALNGGEKLRTWVDYEASSKTLEVRLCKFGNERPDKPLISFSIDMLNLLGDKDILMGISSSSGGGSELNTSVCSWSLKTRTAKQQPEDHEAGQTTTTKKKNCALTILGGVIFATGCGTLAAFFILFLWVILFSRHLEVAPEIPLKTVDFRYERIDVNVDKTADEPTS